MSDQRFLLGINVSILLILMIFGVLLSLPLRLLFNTNYSDNPCEDENNVTNPDSEKERMSVIPIDHRKLKRCPNLQYEDRLMSVFVDDYDKNCTYVQNKYDDDEDDDDDDSDCEEEEGSMEDGEETCESKMGIGEEMKKNVEEILKTRQMKSVMVAGHILVVMLIISVIGALVEVLRIRFHREKRPTDKRFAIFFAELVQTVSRCSDRYAFVKLLHLLFSKMHKDSSRASTITSRRRCSSNVDLPGTRRLISRELIRSQRSFEIPGMHRPALRLLGARPPPLIRRSSFPTPQAKQVATSSLCGTPNTWLPRRQSAESDEELGIANNALHHRIRLIRRH